MTRSDQMKTARLTGFALLATIVIGIVSAMTISAGIDINLSADVEATASAMLDAEMRLRAKAYVGLLLIGLNLLVLFGLYRLLHEDGPLLSLWSVGIGLISTMFGVLGIVAAMNVAHLAGLDAYQSLATGEERLLLAGLQATTDYTSFHLSLVLSSAANAGFFILFLRSGGLPKYIAGWGVFASLFVVAVLVLRDFIPILGGDAVTAAFMISNLTALIALGVYLAVKGVRA